MTSLRVCHGIIPIGTVGYGGAVQGLSPLSLPSTTVEDWYCWPLVGTDILYIVGVGKAYPQG
jgi:hypothetical protein